MTDEEMLSCSEDAKQMERLIAIMHRLRAPGGCPWDREQTHESLISNLLEEAYEVIDTIKRDDPAHMREELGDLLLQVVFHSELAQESSRFSFADVAREISEKLIRRHPHVFGQSAVKDTDGVLTQWEEIKKQEKKDKGQSEQKGYLSGTGKGLPAILRAWKLQKKAAKVGFDWPDANQVLEKVREETEEVQAELDLPAGAQRDKKLEDEIGDLLFVAVNVARKCGIDPEVALNLANEKFERRFRGVERWLQNEGKVLGEANLDELELGWKQAKMEEKA